MFDITQEALECRTLIGSIVVLTELWYRDGIFWKYLFNNLIRMNEENKSTTQRKRAQNFSEKEKLILTDLIC